MKIKIKEIDLHLFANFSEIFYEVNSGMIVGGACSGKTSLLNSISAAFINTDIYGSRINPINVEANVAWSKIYFDVDGQEKICHRTWVKTLTGTSSTSTIKVGDKDLFLSIFNPLWLFSLPNGDREYVLIKHYYGNKDFTPEEIVGEDVSDAVADCISSIGETNIASIKKLEESLKDGKKTLTSELEKQLIRVELLESLHRDEDKKAAEDQLSEIRKDLEDVENWITAVKMIKRSLYGKAVEYIESHLVDTKFNDNGSITWCEKPEKMLSKSELLYCGLEISNAIAANADVIPPTVVEDAIAYEMIDLSAYPNLVQLITTNFADVPLSELNGNVLNGIEQKTSIIPKSHVFVRTDIEEMEII